ELMYVCLQLGFEGRYHIVEGGQRQLEAVRQRLLEIIRRQRGDYERDLSPSWKGVPGLGQPRMFWLPLWVVAAVTALLLAGVYFGFAFSLSGESDKVAASIATLRLAAPAPPRPRAVEPRLAPFLAEDIRRGLVAVDDRPDRSIVTIRGDGLFRPGDAAPRIEDQGLLERIADALTKVPGRVEVIGHTDSVPIRTLRFPSNWELSKARAESVGSVLAARVGRDRINTDGRGETEPVAPNDNPQGQAHNRRVEITLYTPAGASEPSGKP